MVKIYTYKSCSTCRKATQWLRTNELEFEELPIRETPPSVSELEAMLAIYEGELKRLFNTAGGDYRELGLKDTLADMPVSEALELLASRGNLVKRPFLLTADGQGVVGFKEPEWQALLAS